MLNYATFMKHKRNQRVPVKHLLAREYIREAEDYQLL